jgi:hypothetical protein
MAQVLAAGQGVRQERRAVSCRLIYSTVGGPGVEQRELRREYLAALKRYEEATAELRSALERADRNIHVLRSHVEQGLPLNDLIPDLEGAEVRAQLSAAADELERARHDTQRDLYALLLAEGLTMAEIGRAFGVSRSLVSRTLHERD